MEFFKNANYDFIGFRRKAFLISALFILAGVISLVVKGGPALSIDFKGGILINLRFEKPVAVDTVRSALGSTGLGGKAELQTALGGTELIIRAPAEEGKDITGEIKQVIRGALPDNPFQVLREELVGPRVGKELATKAIWATVIALGAMLIYIAWRFEFRFAVAAIIALFHNTIAVVGLFSLTNKEISLAVIAAILTLIGYSINDTIVVFDRIREDLRKYHREAFEVIINRSINETLSRTVVTGTTVVFVLIFLWVMGGQVLRDFTFGMLFGILIGTYSSIFVASPILVEWQMRSPMRRR
ncbi:MAG: protein translocase subunit SecF [bacterium]